MELKIFRREGMLLANIERAAVKDDISAILKGWEYDRGDVHARWVDGTDGARKVQLRLDLGLLQMETEGRPDGLQPRGYPSLLDYYRALEAAGASSKTQLQLGEESCMELQQEAVQYYYRHIALYALGDLDGVIRDTDHNLQILRMASQYAEEDDLAWMFLQFYPYLRMMNARALGERAAGTKKYDEALTAVERGIYDIRMFWREYGEDNEEEDCDELEMLRRMRRHLARKRPKSKAERLRENLDRAIAAEDYEGAAALRDALKKLRS